MKRLCLFASLALLPALAAAEAVQPSPADPIFLASLAEPLEPLTGLGTPAPVPMSCSISRACGDGNTVSCTGTTSCQYSIDGVKCNGNNVPCPNACTSGIDCNCNGTPYFGYCISTAGNCQFSPPACDGQVMDCNFLCPFYPE